MCNRGSWRSFDAQWLQDRLCAIQQCTDCGEHRAVVIEDARVVGVEQRQEEVRQDKNTGQDLTQDDLADDQSPSTDDEGWWSSE